MFEVKKFNSGEWDVKLTERITGSYITIDWNWFKEPDIMIPLMKMDAIYRQYGRRINITIRANYLPYSRQDRVFEIGNSIPFELIVEMLNNMQNIIHLKTIGLHCPCSRYEILENRKHELSRNHYFVFPDENAEKHFYFSSDKFSIEKNLAYFSKVRNEDGVFLKLEKAAPLKKDTVFICDDICDGGRTFIECAKILIEKFGALQINLLVYHAFMTHGLEEIKKYINKIYILNPDSYYYLIDKFPEDKYYFQLEELDV